MVIVHSYQCRWLAAYGVTLGALILLAGILSFSMPNFRNPAVDFYSIDPGAIFNVHGLTRRQEGSLKLGFAESYAPPEIGIYGNHIISHFGAEAFGRPEDAAYFFNYSYANVSLPEIHRYLRHIELIGRLPRKLILVQITPPNADNGRFIIDHGNELPADLLLSDIQSEGHAKKVLKLATVYWELTINRLHGILNYNTLILGLIQGKSYKDRIVGQALCARDIPAWLSRLPSPMQKLVGPPVGHDFYCLRRTWWGALRRDGSVDADFRGDETTTTQSNAGPILDEHPLKETERGLRSGDEAEIARQMRAIHEVGRQHGVRVVFIVPPVYESNRRASLVNRIFDQALALVPNVDALDHRALHADPSLFVTSLHPSPKYYRIVVDELHRRGFIE
jgi:hypothetical protein